MKYDFESFIDRHNMDSIAADPTNDSVYRKDIELKYGIKNHIPMWIADMSFPVFPDIQESIKKRTEHPCFGYFLPREEYYEAIKNWQKNRNGITGIENKNIGYENGVLGGVASALTAFAGKGGKVLVNSPTYVGFTHVLDDCGFEAVHSPLVKDENNIWRLDFEDMEKKIADEKIKAAIFCSPHNPTGRVWERWEIEKAMELFKKYDVQVVSDEIWSDIILKGNKHIPTQSVSEDAKKRTFALYAPSKTFSLAGLVGSYHICYNEKMHEEINKLSTATHYNAMNVLSMYALLGAFTERGYEWTDELCEVLSKNAEYAYNYINENFEGVSLSKPQGTYMIYIDCSEYCKKRGLSLPELMKRGLEVGIDWQNGEDFLVPYTLRVNLSLPFDMVVKVFDRLKKYVFI